MTIPPSLHLRRVRIDTYQENVAYMHRDCPVYRAEGFQALAKVTITQDGRQLIAVLNVVDDAALVRPGELGLSEPAFQNFGLPEGTALAVAQAEPPASMEAVRRKLSGDRFSLEELRAITRDIVDGRYSRMELAAFVIATHHSGMERDEILFLTRAMLETGERLDWGAGSGMVVDKHCIGGIPGNRTSMIVVPIVAAHGLRIPKTSSRAITSPSGTADTMEVLAQVELAPEHLNRVVETEGACLAWGGTARLAPVDDMLIRVERPLGIDSEGQMVASILSKKLAAGSTHLLLDIPVGPSAKVTSTTAALRLRKLFEFVGGGLGLAVEAMITDGRQPVGRGVGPVLEARDVMQVLENHPQAPADLREKSLQLAGRVLEFDPGVRGGEGYRLAREILDSGRALERMQRIIDAQGRRGPPPPPGPLVLEVSAPRAGRVTAIDNHRIARIARLAGAPMDPSAGVDLFCRLDELVAAGQPLYRIYASFRSSFDFACELARRDSGFHLAERA